jgi:hypothetical protein
MTKRIIALYHWEAARVLLIVRLCLDEYENHLNYYILGVPQTNWKRKNIIWSIRKPDNVTNCGPFNTLKQQSIHSSRVVSALKSHGSRHVRPFKQYYNIVKCKQ